MLKTLKAKAGALCLALVLTCFMAMSASAASDFTIENGVLIKYTGSDSNVVIPDGVTSIGESAFEESYTVTSVTIPSGVTSIDQYAFSGCRYLKDVTMPDGITSIGESAFLYCYSLENAAIPSSVTSIGAGAFQDCHLLTSVIIPDGVTAIEDGTFQNCGVKSITIPDSVTSIGNGAFMTSGLESITIPDSVTSIGKNAFIECFNLRSIVIPNRVTSISDGTFLSCTSLESVTVPSSVTSVGQNAFLACPIRDVYYSGSQEEWGHITIHDTGNDSLKFALFIHYNAKGSTPDAPSTAPTPSANTAYASTQSANIDGTAVSFQMYALKDAKGNPTNYVKIRDIAQALNGTAAQFNVTWDGAVNLIPKTAYVPNGSEMHTPYTGDRVYKKATAATKVNGVASNLDAIVLTDDAGGGYTYYKLRDLGQALGFNVGWSKEKGVFIESNKPYQQPL